MGVAETMGEPVRRPLLDAHRAPLGVTAGSQSSRSGGRGGDGGRRRDVGARGEGVNDQG